MGIKVLYMSMIYLILFFKQPLDGKLGSFRKVNLEFWELKLMKSIGV